MKNEFILLICICIAMSIGVSSVSATVTNIDTGENFELIQEAIDDFDTIDGHTVVVDPGVYKENVRVNKSLTIKSINESYEDVTLIGKRADTIIIIGDNVSIIGFRVLSDDGFLISGKRTYFPGICLYGARDCYIANCSIEGTDFGVIIAGQAINNTIAYNEIKESDCGVFIYRGWGRRCANNSILNNSIHDNNSTGIYVIESESTTIINNSIYNNSEDGIYVKDSICEIRHNTVCRNGGWGIYAIDSDESVIEDNICENNGIE